MVFLHCHFSQDSLSHQRNSISDGFLLRLLQLAPTFWRDVELPQQTTDFIYWSLSSSAQLLSHWLPGDFWGEKVVMRPHIQVCASKSTSGQDYVTPKASRVTGFVLLLLFLKYLVTLTWPVQTSQSIFINRSLLLWAELYSLKIPMLKP